MRLFILFGTIVAIVILIGRYFRQFMLISQQRTRRSPHLSLSQSFRKLVRPLKAVARPTQTSATPHAKRSAQPPHTTPHPTTNLPQPRRSLADAESVSPLPSSSQRAKPNPANSSQSRPPRSIPSKAIPLEKQAPSDHVWSHAWNQSLQSDSQPNFGETPTVINPGPVVLANEEPQADNLEQFNFDPAETPTIIRPHRRKPTDDASQHDS